MVSNLTTDKLYEVSYLMKQHTCPIFVEYVSSKAFAFTFTEIHSSGKTGLTFLIEAVSRRCSITT